MLAGAKASFPHASYGHLGYFVSKAASFEHELDLFAFAAKESVADIVRKFSPRFPKSIEDKLMLVITMVTNVPILLRQPIYSNGTLCLQSFFTGSREIFDVRNHLAHGAITLVECAEGKTLYHAKKLRTAGKNAYSFVSFHIGSGLLDKLSHTATVFTHYVFFLKEILEGRFSWESHYQRQKLVLKNRWEFREHNPKEMIPSLRQSERGN